MLPAKQDTVMMTFLNALFSYSLLFEHTNETDTTSDSFAKKKERQSKKKEKGRQIVSKLQATSEKLEIS